VAHFQVINQYCRPASFIIHNLCSCCSVFIFSFSCPQRPAGWMGTLPTEELLAPAATMACQQWFPTSGIILPLVKPVIALCRFFLYPRLILVFCFASTKASFSFWKPRAITFLWRKWRTEDKAFTDKYIITVPSPYRFLIYTRYSFFEIWTPNITARKFFVIVALSVLEQEHIFKSFERGKYVDGLFPPPFARCPFQLYIT